MVTIMDELINLVNSEINLRMRIDWVHEFAAFEACQQ